MVLEGVPGSPQLNGEFVTKWTLVEVKVFPFGFMLRSQVFLYIIKRGFNLQ